MATSTILHNMCSVSSYSPNCHKNQTLALTGSRLLHSSSFLKLKKQPLLSNTLTRELKIHKARSSTVVYAAQSNFLKVLQTVWKVGKDGVDVGTNLVPESIPRPIARISVTIVASTVALYVLKSFLSTAFFVLCTMGLAYFMYIALNKDDGPRGGADSTIKRADSTSMVDDPVEEARRIMEKYK